LEIIGDGGTLRWDNTNGVTMFQAGENEWKVFPISPGFERNQLFFSEMQHFISVIQGQAQPRCTLDDGVQALRLVQAAHQSSQDEILIRLSPVWY